MDISQMQAALQTLPALRVRNLNAQDGFEIEVDFAALVPSFNPPKSQKEIDKRAEFLRIRNELIACQKTIKKFKGIIKRKRAEVMHSKGRLVRDDELRQSVIDEKEDKNWVAPPKPKPQLLADYQRLDLQGRVEMAEAEIEGAEQGIIQSVLMIHLYLSAIKKESDAANAADSEGLK